MQERQVKFFGKPKNILELGSQGENKNKAICQERGGEVPLLNQKISLGREVRGRTKIG